MKSKKLSPLAVYLVCAAAIVLLLAAQISIQNHWQCSIQGPAVDRAHSRGFGAVLSGKPRISMAFGLLQDQYWLFAMMTVLFLIVMVIVFLQANKDRFLPLFAVLTVLTAGAVGNFYDRFLNHYVI